MTGPLDSLKILDFSTLLPGPFATMLLADLGAEIIRVESPAQPDMVRSVPPFIDGVSAWHATLQRSKRALALDLKQPEGKRIVQQLILTHDIILEQFRPGVMERLGLAYEGLREINPRLIYCALTGYGQTGPMSKRAGHDINYLALSGISSHTGRVNDGPLPLGVQVADVGAGSMMAIMGILSAVIQRYQSGAGQFVDVSMFDGAISWNALAIAQLFASGESPGPETGLLNGGSAYDYYQTQDGRYLSVGSLEPKFWTAFCEVIERPDLLDQGSSPDPAVQSKLKAEITQIIAARPLGEWETRFAKVDACVEPVSTTAEMTSHPQSRARSMIVDVPTPAGGSHRQVGQPVKFSAAQPTFRHIGAALGAHSEEILGELGYRDEEIADLRDRGVVV